MKHKRKCKLQGENISEYGKDNLCYAGNYEEWLIHISPDIFWFNIQDVGSYQGRVYGVGVYKKKLIIYEGYYGSCSGCGAWSEGGQPTNQKEVLSSSKQFTKIDKAKEHCALMSSYDRPDWEPFFKAMNKADKWRLAKIGK